MEHLANPLMWAPVKQQEEQSSSNAFIEANTRPCSLEEIRERHIIPVWMKDNQPLISLADLIGTTVDAVEDIFHGEHILKPSIRLSHPVKGRIPSAKDKPVHLLTADEETIYYERMMFVIEVPSIQGIVGGNTLSLTIGAVKSYGEDNLYQKAGGDQHFKVFVGFQNKVCTNLCVWSDGYTGSFSVKNHKELSVMIHALLEGYRSDHHLRTLQQLVHYAVSEQQFAHTIGRARVFQHMPAGSRSGIPPLLLGDQQLGHVVRDYYKDRSFSRNLDGSISLWKLYNLLTGANKSTYLDQFLDRTVNAYGFVDQIKDALDGQNTSWYLN